MKRTVVGAILGAAVATVVCLVATRGGAARHQERLTALLPATLRDRCTPEGPGDALAAVVCSDGDVHASYKLFRDKPAMDAAFDARARRTDKPGTDCEHEPNARQSYASAGQTVGQLYCERGPFSSSIAWTDDRALVLGEASRADTGDADLFAWWATASAASAKDPSAPPPHVPEGTFITSLGDLAEPEQQKLLDAFREVAFEWEGGVATFGLHLEGRSYWVTRSSLSRLARIERGTFALTKAPKGSASPLATFTSDCDTGTRVSATYTWHAVPDGGVSWALEGLPVDGTGQRAKRCVPGPWPLTWLPPPPGEIVFSTGDPGLETHGVFPKTELVVLSLSSLEFRVVPVDAKVGAVQPVWSPDGSHLVFAANRDKNYDLFVSEPDGGKARQLTSGPNDDLDPTWSPDGTKIAYHGGPPGNDFKAEAVHWTDADMMRTSTALNVVTVADGHSSSILVRNGFIGHTAWSPDGKQIAFRIWHVVGINPRKTFTEICVASPDGSGFKKLAETRMAGDSAPAWTPDGKRIVFWGDGEKWPVLRSVAVDGTDTRIFEPELPGGYVVPSWSPDARWIVAGGPWDTAHEIYLVSADGKRRYQVESRPSGEPKWRPTSH